MSSKPRPVERPGRSGEGLRDFSEPEHFSNTLQLRLLLQLEECQYSAVSNWGLKVSTGLAAK